MADTECVECGVTFEEIESGDWYYCSECESAFCPDCTNKLEEKQKKTGKTKIQKLTCPKCGTELTYYPSIP